MEIIKAIGVLASSFAGGAGFITAICTAITMVGGILWCCNQIEEACHPR